MLLADFDVFLPRAIERIVIAFCVPLLFWIGYKLLVLGIEGKIKLKLKSNTSELHAANLTPGTMCFILACGLGSWIMSSSVKQDVRSGPAGSSSSTQGTNTSSLDQNSQTLKPVQGYLNEKSTTD